MLARRLPLVLPIRVRIAIAYTLFLACTIGIVGVCVVELLQAELLREIDGSLRLRATWIVTGANANIGGDGVLDEREARMALADLPPGQEISAPGIYVQILSDKGAILASSPDLPYPEFLPPAGVVTRALSGTVDFGEMTVGSDRVRFLAQPMLSGTQVVGVVVVGRSLHMYDLTGRHSVQLIAVATLIAMAVSFGGGWLLTGRTLRPISQITRVARSIARTGQFEQQIPSSRSHDELGELVATFNEMLERIASTLHHQQEFLADASHELRSPLTIIRGNLDLLGSELPEAERELSIRVVKNEVDRMSRLVSDLLFLAEVDAREMILRDEVKLDQVIASVYLRLKDVDRQMHAVTLDHNDPIVVIGDGARLEQMVWNLVDNACRYTPPGGRVVLSLRQTREAAEIIVSDTGIGIPPEHLPRVFERFYRLDQARNRAKGGTGLGLAIVRQIAGAHGGDVTVESVVGRGTIFRVRLPAFPC